MIGSGLNKEIAKARLGLVPAICLAFSLQACVQASGGGPMLSGREANLPLMIRTQQGMVRGAFSRASGVTVFKGIPFAQPPVGDLRWKEAQAPLPWQGVRDASEWGDACVQVSAPDRSPPNITVDLPDSPPMSEDCLTLNVWTPADNVKDKLPVMVWVYGGAYTEGGGHSPYSEAHNLAAKGTVVVSFNYRLGPFGFFSHPELSAENQLGTSGNQALSDALAALDWVQANIEQFGGDPGNITIFGQSAGAAVNAGLVGSPIARGKFQRAISQSGGWMGLGIGMMATRADAETRTIDQAERLFGSTSLAALRALPATEIQMLRGAGMIVDGRIIPEDLSVTFLSGRQNAVDILVGSNGDEGSFTTAMGPPMTLDAWMAGEQQRWGGLVELGRTAYPATTDAGAIAQAAAPFSDALSWHMRLYAELQAEAGGNAYHYWFTHEPPYDPAKPDLGSAHTAELPYVFDYLSGPRVFPADSSIALMAGNPREEQFADQVSQYWVNFARTGNPNGEGLPYWHGVQELGPNQTMVLDADGSGASAWLGAAKTALFQAQFNSRVVDPLGLAEVP